MAITFNGTDKIIQLDSATTVSIRAIYSAWVDWVATSDNMKFQKAFSTIADPPTVPVYVTLLNGWRLKAFENGSAYTLTLDSGFIYVDGGGDPFTTNGGVEPRVRYENPVIAVGFSSGSGLSAGQSAQLQELHDMFSEVEGSFDAKDVMRLMMAALLGKASGGGTSSVTFRDTGDTKDRITATVDSNGNRQSVTLDAT